MIFNIECFFNFSFKFHLDITDLIVFGIYIYIYIVLIENYKISFTFKNINRILLLSQIDFNWLYKTIIILY